MAIRPSEGWTQARFPAGRILLAGFLLLSLFATASHLYLSFNGTAHGRPLLVLDHIFDLSLTLTLLALCASVGQLTLSKCRVTFDQPIETLSFSMALGAGMVGASILVCGLLSGFRAPLLGLLLLFCAFVARNELSTLLSLCSQVWHALRINRGVLNPSIFCAVVIFMTSQALAPPTEWDSLMYHLRVPTQFLQQGRVYLPDDDLHVPFIGLVHMLYMPLLAMGSSAGPALISAFLAIMLGLAVFGFCTRFFGGQTADLSLSLLWGSTVLLLTAITARLDVTLAWYLFLAQYALIIALAARPVPAYFYLSAVLLGFSIGVKYLSLAYLAALSPLILWFAARNARTIKAWVCLLLTFAVFSLSAALPSLIKNWLLFGVPLFPLLAQRRLASWLVPIYGGRSVPQGVNPQIFHILSYVTVPFNFSDLLWAPGRLTVEDQGAFYFFNPILYVLPLCLLFVRNRTLNWLLFPSLAYCLLVLASYPNIRYLIPALAPLTIAAVYVVVRLVTRVSTPSVARVLFSLLTMLTLVRSGETAYLWTSNTALLKYLSGASSMQEYLNRSTSFYPATFFLNHHVGAHTRVVMLFEGRGYYFNGHVIQDNDMTNWPLLAPKAAGHDCLRAEDINYLLINWIAVGYYVYRGVDPQLLQLPSLREFLVRCTTPVYQRRGLSVYELTR